MLDHTFIHLPKIGPTTERRLWQAGVHTWDDFLSAPQLPRISPGRRLDLCRLLAESRRCLDQGDHTHFANRLAPAEHWRAYPQFRRRVAYLDIETTGLGPPHSVTVVGLYDGSRTRTYVAGDNLAQFAEDIQDYALLVTYNGATFDLPFLRYAFPGLQFHQMHVDLRYALGRLGLRGGLKRIEQRLGLQRNERIAGLDGWDAVRLWHEYQRGSEKSLALLIEYNSADIVNLETLMQAAYRGLRQQATGGVLP